MPGYNELQNLIGNDPFQRLMRDRANFERSALQHGGAGPYALPSLSGGAEPRNPGISWMEPANRGQIRDFGNERALQAAFIARYGMTPQDIMEGYRVNNILAEDGVADGNAGNPLTSVLKRIDASPDNYVMASRRNPPAAAPATGLGALPAAPKPAAASGTGLNLRPAALGKGEGSFAGFKSGLSGIPTPDSLAGAYDVGQRFDKMGNPISSSPASPVNITAGQKAKGDALKRITSASLALTEAKTDAEKAKADAAMSKAAPGAKPSEAQKAVDRNFAKDYTSYVSGGGYADVNTQIANVEDVIKRLKSGKENLTGPMISMVPDRMRPAAKAAQQAVEQSIQRSLRQTLGAQFTENEGKLFMQRGYDPTLPERENVKKLETMIGQLKMMARAKQDAANYYEKNGTLVGYKGKMYTLANGQIVEEDAPTSAFPNSDPAGLGI